jgi:hypothetical protein
MRLLSLWGLSRLVLGTAVCCFLFPAGCSRNENGPATSLRGDSGHQLRELAADPALAQPAPLPPIPIGPPALNAGVPLQQVENGYWIVTDSATAMPPLFPAGISAFPAAPDPRFKEYAASRDASVFARARPFFDDAALAQAKAAIQNAAASMGAGGALAWNIGDGAALSAGGMPFDDDRSTLMLSVFREWLKSQYPSLEALNAQWGTAFQHWQEIVPRTTDATKNLNFPGYDSLFTRMMAPPPAPDPLAAVQPKLPDDIQIEKRRGPPEPDWDVRDGVRGFALAFPNSQPATHANFSSWSDWRTFNDFVFNRLLREYAATARAAGIAAPLGLRDAFPPLAFNCTDWQKLSGGIGWIEPGESAFARELLRDLAPHVKRLTRVENGGDAALFQLWDNWLRGDSGALVAPAALDADNGALRGELQFLSRTLEPLRQRVTRKIDPIGIYYSPRSMQMHWMLDSAFDGSWWLERSPAAEQSHNSGLLQFNAWRMLLDDLGYEPGYIQPEFVTSRKLLDSRFKVLILPKVLCLSEQEAAELRGWVKRGGIVIADGACGLYDEHGKRRIAPNINEWPIGILDADFGIQRTGGTLLEANGAFHGGAGDRAYLKDRVTGYAFGPSTSELRVLEPEVLEAGAYCHSVSTAGAAALLSRAGGLGRFLYLNLAMQDYPRLRARPVCEDFTFEGISLLDYEEKYGIPRGGEALRLIVGDMLSEIAPPSPIAVHDADGLPLRGIRRALFDAGAGCQVVVLLPNGAVSPDIQAAKYVKGMLKVDGRVIETPTPALVSLPGNYYWYDVRTGQDLGYGPQAAVQLLADRVTVLAALPYRAPRLRVSSRRVNPDGVFRVQATVVSDQPATGTHVFKTELLSPDGDIERQTAELVPTENGLATWTVALPADAPPGTHRLLIRDLLTGKQNEAQLLKD